MFKGIAGSKGIAFGPAFILENKSKTFESNKISADLVDTELAKILLAAKNSRDEIEEVRDKALCEIGIDKAKIFDAHLLILEDEAFLGEIKTLIKSEFYTAATATKIVTEKLFTMLCNVSDEYMKERAADIKDVGERLLKHLLGGKDNGLDRLSREVIVIAHDLTPSDTIIMDKHYVKGFATDIGSYTSHVAIVARTLEVPAVIGLKDISTQVIEGDFIIIDGTAGKVFVNPEPSVMDTYRKKQTAFMRYKRQIERDALLPAQTIDGYNVEVAANIGSPADIEAALAVGAEGVGLYRTEFLYMNHTELPNEEIQFAAYKRATELLNGKPLIIRTLDIGGDKEVAAIPIPKEMNPFLGWRAIRICLARKDVFRTQLRAILRASAFGNIFLMYPMISCVTEVRAANAILAEVKNELEEEGVAFDKGIKVGIMVEIPSAAVTADIIAKEVDFFSIGTNDLCQYTLAVDRMNEQVSMLYRPFHPSILRLIKNVIDASHSAGIFTGMCGEMAGDPLAVLLLTGLGLDELSMSAASIPSAKKIIQSFTYEEAHLVALHALTLETPEEVESYLRNFLAQSGLLAVIEA